MAENYNDESLADFASYVTNMKPGMKRQYDRGINRDLSRQKWENLFKRNITSVLKQVYEDSFHHLQDLSLNPQALKTEKEFSEITFQVLKPFEGLVEELMQYALQKHRTSCAISNFPPEHDPSKEYIDEVIQEVSSDWQSFAMKVDHFLSR